MTGSADCDASLKGEGMVFVGAEETVFQIPCDAPAPLVVNGSLFVGCQLTKDHTGPHEVKIAWPR